MEQEKFERSDFRWTIIGLGIHPSLVQSIRLVPLPGGTLTMHVDYHACNVEDLTACPIPGPSKMEHPPRIMFLDADGNAMDEYIVWWKGDPVHIPFVELKYEWTAGGYSHIVQRAILCDVSLERVRNWAQP